LLLAVLVMLGHLSFYPHALPFMLPGSVAVEAFYVVSGFLITLVLSEKYDGRPFLFYSNRVLRLFPIYWGCLLLYIIANVLVVHGFVRTVTFADVADIPSTSALWWAYQHPLGTAQRVGVAFLNIFIVGQDIIRGLGEPTPNLYYHFFVYVRVAWTVAVELSFYAIAPFVVRRIPLTVGVLIASLVAQFLVIGNDKVNPLDYELFPFEAWLFMAGSLSYRVYAKLRLQQTRGVTIYCVAASVLLLAMTVTYDALSTPRVVYLVTAAACLPGAVLLGRKNPADGALGDFSYPIYLIHPLAMIVTIPGRHAELIAIAAVLLLSWLTVRFIERPIERFRQRRVGRKPAPTKASWRWTAMGPSQETVVEPERPAV
jgi:peptidoglycan/LPS O-acetylase OafA/YrhL